ncbi:MAG: hypothetical protein E7031_01270 [Akkermansiaceae bacterium]|nr:hypothetical protein [Akkermansiaceae bacterium]
MNISPKIQKQGILPASTYEFDAVYSLSYYERTGGDYAIYKREKSTKEGERYTLTFASSKAGTYTYENIVNGVRIGHGEGIFDVEELED